MKIIDFIKSKQLEYLNAKLKMMREDYSEKDLRQIKDKIFDIQYENKMEVSGYTECLNEEIKSSEMLKGCCIMFNDLYVYNPLKNTMTKIIPNQGNDLAEGFKRRK